jgi:hypothetical protein
MIRDLSQVVFFAAWFVVLYRYQPLRNLVRAAPRGLTIPLGLLVAGWLLAQLTDQRVRYFPFISVYMYGDHTPMKAISGVRLRGVWCDGTQGPLNLGFMGRASLRSRVQNLYDGLPYRRTAADSAQRWDIIDRTVTSIGRMHNRTFPDRPLCSIALDQIRLEAGQYESGTIPPPRQVHDVVVR